MINRAPIAKSATQSAGKATAKVPAKGLAPSRKATWLTLVGGAVLAVVMLGPQPSAEKAVLVPAFRVQGALVGAAPSLPDAGAPNAPTAPIAPNAPNAPLSPIIQTAVFAGGCFWGVQAVFQHTKGVLNAVSGYAGGNAQDANYDSVSAGSSGHAEAVQVSFDARQISYAQLLQIYFSVAHDPTQLNRQYPDIGKQYRSAIFTTDATQTQQAAAYVAQLDAAQVFKSKIVTQVSALNRFYPAERYHQNYATLHPDAAYIARFDLPKLANLKALLPAFYRETPVLVVN